MKRMICILLSLFLLITLPACAPEIRANPDWEENILVFAATASWTLSSCQQMADEFNSTHTDVQIEVRDYSDENGLQRLRTEILAGKIPDIMETGRLPYRQLAQKGYLEDLWPYIENDPELGRDAVMEPPLRAAEIDGGLYTVFSSVYINTLIGSARVVGDRLSWTMEDLQEAFATMPEDSTITDFYITKDWIFDMICTMNLDSYVDWNTGKCSFDNESFRNILEFVNSFPDECDYDPAEGGLDELLERRNSGRQMLWNTPFADLSEIQSFDLIYGEKTTFIGYPVGDDSVGSSFVLNGALSISSVCRNKEAAWEFLRTRLLTRYDRTEMTEAIENGNLYFPVNRADFDLMLKLYTDDGPERPSRGVVIGNEIIDLPPLTEEEIARFENLYNSIDKIGLSDSQMRGVVFEACGPYFSGDKTLDQTVKLVQNKMKLYVNEQR